MNKKRILIIEDDDVTRKLLELSFKTVDVDVDLACNGLVALDMLSLNTYDLILTDMMMPIMNGDAVLDFISNNLDYNPKVIVLSASNSENTSLKAFNQGADDFLVKPFSFSKITLSVFNALSG